MICKCANNVWIMPIVKEEILYKLAKAIGDLMTSLLKYSNAMFMKIASVKKLFWKVQNGRNI